MHDFVKRIRFIPEFSLGNILQIVLVFIPAVIYLAKLDARVASNEKTVQKLIIQDEKKTESISLLRENQAVLSALMDMHTGAKPKATGPVKSN